MSGISLIIPTYKRKIDFERTLHSVNKQIEDINEVITIIGPNDLESFNLASSFKSKLRNMKVIQSEKASVVHALNLGLQASTQDILCLTDDDIELPEGWAKRIKKAFKENTDMGAYGGPDKLISEELKDLAYNPVKEVGLFRWYGMVGNHHLGVKESPAVVDVLKGVNFSFRRDSLEDLSIDMFLKDRGAEQCWEIDLVQKIQGNGYKVIYDNENYLFHYISQRQQYDQRRDVFSVINYTNIKNMAYVYAKFRPFNEILFIIFYGLFIGTKVQPGIVRAFTMIKNYGLKVVLVPFKNVKAVGLGVFNGFRFRIKRNVFAKHKKRF
ncbi:glycosyltransferase family 2 protein [Litoribaculum gwangyangense]|uniref:Glycosyltransferase n=1 Tax=Litoribaculum gwangyangense TaxID=1130722 RepID=A0ABP9CWK9_9FLAO